MTAIDTGTWLVMLVLALGFFVGLLVMPVWLFVVCGVVSLLLLVSMLTVQRWPRRLRYGLIHRVTIPRWVWLSIGLGFAGVGVLVNHDLFGWEVVLSVIAMALGVGFIAGTIYADSWIGRTNAPPLWLLGFLLILAIPPTLALIGRLAALTLLFLGALIVFAIQIWVILPLALVQLRSESTYTASAPYPSVSVLIPAYNEAAFIGDSIDSVLASTYPEDQLEVIVVDDGSDDATYDIALAHATEQVHVIQRENGGKYAALNMGLAFASGEIIVSLDGDSVLAPSAIDEIVGQFQAEPEVGGVAGTVYVANDTRHITRLQALEYAFSIQTFRRVYSLFGVVPLLPGCLSAFRRESLDAIWGFDPDTRTEDFDATIQILKQGWITRHSAAVVHTHAPTTWKGLWKQRLRWFGGNIETVIKHRDICTNPTFGYLHSLVIPARLVSTLLIPAASFMIAAAVLYALMFGPTVYVLTVGVFFLLMTVLVLWVTIRMDNQSISLLGYAPLFFIGYKHLLDTNLLLATWQAFRGRGEDW